MQFREPQFPAPPARVCIQVDHGVTELNRTVMHFMVLASARTGSNFLLSLLSAHPQIKTYGELFNLDTLPREDQQEALECPIAFLKRRIYKPHRPGISAVGFKMFYEHLTKDYFHKPVNVSDAAPEMQSVFATFAHFIQSNYSWDVLEQRFRSTWDYLRADPSLAIIHLKRRNMLHTLISLKRAFATRQWWTFAEGGQATRAIHLDPNECVRYFQTIDSSSAEADFGFRGHKMVTIFYEDMVDQQEDTLQRIFSFLDVSPQPVTTRMKKQNLALPQETVDNYDELKTYFRNTKWAFCFD